MKKAEKLRELVDSIETELDNLVEFLITNLNAHLEGGVEQKRRQSRILAFRLLEKFDKLSEEFEG